MQLTPSLLLALKETTLYPALLARLDKLTGKEQPLSPTELLDDLLEAEMGEETNEARFSLLLEEGEIAAARKLHSLMEAGPRERARVVRHASAFKQELEACLRRIMGLLLLLKETDGKRLQHLREQAEALADNQTLQESRPGCVLRHLAPIERELEQICRETLEELRKQTLALEDEPRVSQERDVSLAFRRLQLLLDSPESLPDAQQMLLLLQRAMEGELNPEDLRQLHMSQLERQVRLVRPWTELRDLGVQTADEILQLLQREDCPVFFKSTNYQQNALDLFRCFLPQGKRLRVERACAKLYDFLHLTAPEGPAATTKHGIRYSLRFVEPRVPAFRSGRLRTQLQLVFPVHADPSHLQRLLQSIPKDVFPIVYFPGCLDTSLRELFRLREDVAHFDNLDLLRLVECRLDQREHAFQQLLLPRCPIARVEPWQLSGPVALEMFRGRHAVLERLKTPRGGTVLFSGRMMGKSSILDKMAAEAVSNGRHCIKLSNVGGSLIKPLVERVAELLPQKEGERLLADDKALQPAPSLTPTRKSQRRQERLARLQQALRELLRSDESFHLTLLVDEADHFAAEDSRVPRNESLAWMLRDLEYNHVEQLRIVFAGFQTIHHQVISGHSAFANWFGLAQLTTLDKLDAHSLVEEPFADFGFLFASNAGINRILEFTGQHPLLIQETSSRLMQRMVARRQRGQEDEVIQIHAGDVESICRDDQLRDRVHQVLSLNLNQYPRLKLMVYLILYSTSYGDSQAQFTLKSFRLEDLKALLLEWYQERLNEYFDEKSIGALVQELMTLGLLARRGETYEFVNTTFASMLLEDARFESELERLLALVVNPDNSEPRRFPTLLTEDLERFRHGREQNFLFTGLSGSMRTGIARAMFEEDQEALLLAVDGCSTLEEVEVLLKNKLDERRKTLSFSDLLLKNQIRTLVFDGLGALKDAEGLLHIAEELSLRGQRLIAFGGAELARCFSEVLCAGEFELLSLRRLRVRDIKAWGTKLPETEDMQIVLDERTCKELLRVTGGFLPLLTPFKHYCVQNMQHAREYFPNREMVFSYEKSLSNQRIGEALLGDLKETERELLKSLFVKAEEEDIWQFDYKFMEEFLLGRPLTTKEMDILEVLQHLHLLETTHSEGRRLLQLRVNGPLRRFFGGETTNS